MKSIVAPILSHGFVLLVVSCSAIGSPDVLGKETPEGTFVRVQQILRKQDFDAFFEMLSSHTKRAFIGYIREMGPAMRKQLKDQGLEPGKFLRMHPKQAFVQILARGVELDPGLFRSQ